MKRLLFCLVILLTGKVCFGQLWDDFSDGDLSNNPAWSGDVGNFKVNSSAELQLNAPDAGSSTIFTQVAIPDSCEWQFYFRLDFAPSNTNLLRVYLQSDIDDLSSGKSYYLEVGETGNLDALKFFRQDAPGTQQLLGSFSLGTLANQPATARIKVFRNSSGLWQFYADYTGGKNFVKELEVTDGTYTGGNNYFGFYCLYSATRKDKFFFDEISVKQPIPDIEPPVIVSWEITDDHSFALAFDDSLDVTSIGDLSNYFVNNGVGSAVSAMQDQINPNKVNISFANSFVPFQSYTLSVKGVKDIAGNVMIQKDIDFVYTVGKSPETGEILINEVMADPSPVVGLPEVEFVELYNISASVISTKGLLFSDGSSSASLPELNLIPGGYYILCAQKDTSLLKIFGKTIGVPTLPSINNSGDNLVLTTSSGLVIDAVSFSDTWYADNAKKDGGWTLELINPLDKCSGKANWKASISAIGGTPGKQNSVYNPAQDTEAPSITNVFAVNKDSILVNFNEKTDSDPAQFIDLFIINGNVDVVDLIPTSDNLGLLLIVEPSLTEGIMYELSMKAGFKDCAGNATTQTQEFGFALPAKPGLHDLVLNEILYNPLPSGFDYLEIYNRSDKIFNLADLTIVNAYDKGTRVKQTSNQLILPHSYIVLTVDPDNIRNNYHVPDTALLVQTSIPSYNDDKGIPGIVYVKDSTDVWIDSIYYDKNFQYALLSGQDGVAWERINFNSFLTGKANWHSAASTAGFGTPGYINSQYYDGAKVYSKGEFKLSSKRVSPDNDGYEDFILIDCTFKQPGFTITANVYDAQGRLVKKIANNELAGLHNTFEWNGLNEEQLSPPLGIYIIYMQYFDLEGNVYEEKIPVVVAGSF